LDIQQEEFDTLFPKSAIHYLHIDFTEDLPLPQLDGILMANSLHFLKNQEKFLAKIMQYLKPQGTFVLVEYNSPEGNPWVPYPVTFEKFEMLAKNAELSSPRLLHTVPSQFMHEIYSAVAKRY
jgi:SAM-dependent methyltransferase